MKTATSILFALAVLASSVMAEEGDRMLFTFNKPDSGTRWQTVNDGVMGGHPTGVSESTIKK